MKGKLPLLLLALALVAAVAWLARPTEEDPAPTASSPPPPRENRPAGVSAKPDRTTTTPRQPSNGGGLRISPEMITRMLSSQRMRTDKEIATLVRMFGLSKDQEALLREWYDGQLAGMEARLNNSGGLSIAELQDLAAGMRSVGLDQVLDSILTDEQRGDLERMAGTDQHQHVERHVVSKLKDLKETLDLTPPQLRALRQVLYEDAARRYEQVASQSPFHSLVSNGRGIDLADPGIDFDSAPGGGGSSFEDFSEEERLEILRTGRSEYIAEVIGKYGRVLTPEQAESYRATLESQSSRAIEDAMATRPLRPDRNPSELPLIRGISRK